MGLQSFEYYSRRNWRGQKRWHFRIVAPNGQIVASGDPSGYHNFGDMIKTIQGIIQRSATAVVREVAR